MHRDLQTLLFALGIIVVGVLLAWLAHVVFGLPMCTFRAHFWGWC